MSHSFALKFIAICAGLMPSFCVFSQVTLEQQQVETGSYYKATQLCQEGRKTGSNPWTEIPTQGTSTRGIKYPAALLNVIAPAGVTPSGTPAAKPASDPHSGHKH